MDPYLVSGVMPDYSVITVDHGPYVILIHAAVGYINGVTFFTIRKNDRNRLFEFHHLVTRYIMTPQKRRHAVMTDA